MARVFLALGSNQGDSPRLIRSAFDELSRLLFEPRLSRLWRTAPLYVEDQPDFVNAAASGETSLGPRELLAATQAIESTYGRDRSRERPKGPRSLDIDILLYDALVLDEPDLVIPHAGLKERLFALLPLLDLDPALRDPSSGESYASIAKTLPNQGIYLMG